MRVSLETFNLKNIANNTIQSTKEKDLEHRAYKKVTFPIVSSSNTVASNSESNDGKGKIESDFPKMANNVIEIIKKMANKNINSISLAAHCNINIKN